MKALQDGNLVTRLPLLVDRRGICREFSGASPVQLDYVQGGSNVVVTTTTAATAQVVLQGASIHFDGKTRVRVDYFAAYLDATVNAKINLWFDSTDLGIIAQITSFGANTFSAPVHGVMFYTPSVGIHNFSARAWKSSGTVNIGAVSGTFTETFLRVTAA